MSTLTRKTLVALSGLSLCVFLVVHVLGNAPLLADAEQGRLSLNHYAAWLSERAVIELLSWALLGLFVGHAGIGLRLAMAARIARGPRIAGSAQTSMGPWQTRALGTSGLVLLVFLGVHLADFWFPYKFDVSVGLDTEGRRDLYTVVFRALQHPWRVALYLVAMVALGVHLGHGVFSATRTLGVSAPVAARWLRYVGWAVALLIPTAFATMVIGLYFQGAHS